MVKKARRGAGSLARLLRIANEGEQRIISAYDPLCAVGQAPTAPVGPMALLRMREHQPAPSRWLVLLGQGYQQHCFCPADSDLGGGREGGRTWAGGGQPGLGHAAPSAHRNWQGKLPFASFPVCLGTAEAASKALSRGRVPQCGLCGFLSSAPIT